MRTRALAATFLLVGLSTSAAEQPSGRAADRTDVPFLDGVLQLAMKAKPPGCVPVLCYKDKIGWCMCDPCSHVDDCRAATGGKATGARRLMETPPAIKSDADR